MRVVLLTMVAMTAFAANSVLNRMAVGAGLVDPLTFAWVRLLAGAMALGLLVALRAVLRGGALWAGWRGRVAGVAGLLIYLLAFSLAYRSLDAGIGALILFGSVQITMFGGALMAREVVPLARWLGAGLAFAGLVLLLATGGAQVPGREAALMACAGMGWGVYSLAGRRAKDALGATAWNFMLAVPVLFVLLAMVPPSADAPAAQVLGLWLAVVSGAVTSGLGYALWYHLVPQLGAARAAVAQLTVPVLAAGGGALWLGEGVGLRFAVAAALVLGGVAVANLPAGKRLGAGR
ncbi:MAG: DMT family transporter [Rhodobacteraceae bacterium]|nr:DMT family transporter [Paracoccaceae bacterium]MCF8514593.1 DMT family transporter [Paracoccaceae bacterium]MCF8518866.1 DMT family transporter [Paracoccaceae bacterium]